MSLSKPPSVKPRIIIHGGAGNITRDNLPPEAHNAYKSALLKILRDANFRLQSRHFNALDIATFAVTQLENNPLFNSGHGAVYTRAGTHELEASVMVSSGYRKRGVGVMGLNHVRNPILLAREVLVRGEEIDGGGAQGHVQLHGETCERLAREWGLEMVRPSYFWTRKRWEEHRRGLGKEVGGGEYEKGRKAADAGECEHEAVSGFDGEAVTDDPSWNGKDYLPQGTVGCVVLDQYGILCVATSTGGLTNKLPGRIGDTPTLGAGFWAEEWHFAPSVPSPLYTAPPVLSSLISIISECLPALSDYSKVHLPREGQSIKRAVAMSGTGNGDSFLRLAAVRTAAAIARFSISPSTLSSSSKYLTLQDAVTAVAGSHGMLQQSAEDRWHKTGEGEGGIIGIEFDETRGDGKVVADFNCGGMFRCWIDDEGKSQFMVLREEY